MEIQQLRHLIAAVRCGNLVKAADQCNISQSGLSRSIKSLEDRLGVPLLIRKPKGVEPTIFGLNFVDRAKLILAEIDRSMEELRALNAAELGESVFGITQNYGFYFIPDVIKTLHEENTGVRVNVVTGGFLDLVRELRAGSIDFAFGLIGRMDEANDVTVEMLRDHHSRVVARSDHPLALKEGEVTPEELAKASWATLSGEGFQRIFSDYFFTHGLTAPTHVLKSDSVALIRQIVSESDLLAVLPPQLVGDQVDNGSLAILDCEAPAEQTQVGLMFRTNGLITPQSRLIVERIRKSLTGRASN